MKKGLGRIPKSLSWIDSMEPQEAMAQLEPTNQRETTTQKNKQKTKAPNQHEITHKKMTMTVEEEPSTTTASSCRNGLPEGWTRATYIVHHELNENIKAIAYWERLTVKEVIHDALTQYMQGKNVKPIPKKKRDV